MVYIGCNDMPTTLTLKNIPDHLYERLRRTATIHRRSLNSEAIVCLESVLLPSVMQPSERIARAQALRADLPPVFDDADIAQFKQQGRP
jgi:antitoxin FitA